MAEIRNFVERMLDWQLDQLASTGTTDVMVIYGPMHDYLPELVKVEIEEMRKEVENNNKTLTILLDTGGGSVDSVERTVRVIRHHYDVVDFIG